jgi:cohesin loading factor subunit SCC2
MLWEARTHLRRLYGLNSTHKDKDGNAKQSAKELNKTTSKVHGVTGEKFWEAVLKNMSSLDSEEAMLTKCREFSTLLAIDDEFKVDRDHDAEGDSLDALVDADDMTSFSGSRPMKRKSSVSSTGLNKRPKARKSSVGKKPSGAESDDGWE